jgi:uncharacterized membrane protein YukC
MNPNPSKHFCIFLL